MEYTEQRGLKISKLTLGAVQLGINYGINNKSGKPDEKASFEILKNAVNGGISAIDTAQEYGDSEITVGKFVNNFDGEKPTVITKFKIGNTDGVTDIEKTLRYKVESSLNNLHLSKLPLLMFHDENEITAYGDSVIKSLKKMKSEGMICRIGASLQTDKYMDYIIENDLFEAIQLPLNMMDTKIIKKGWLDKLYKADIITFVRSVFLQGLLFMEPENLPQGILQNAAEPLRAIREIAKSENIEIAQLAVSFIRDLKGVSSLVLGCETSEQVSKNLELINAPSLSAKLRNEILNMFDDIEPKVLMPWTWNK